MENKDDESMAAVTEHVGYAPREQVEQFLASLPGDRCWRCKFFDPAEQVTSDETRLGDFVSITHNLEGDCRRHAPRPLLDTETIDRGAIWPWVQGRDWCGEFVQCDRTVDDLTCPPIDP